MSTVRALLITKLRATSALMALLNDGPRFGHFDTNARLPYITCTQVSSTYTEAADAYTGLQETRIQLDIWAKDSLSAASIAAIVKTALHRWKDATLTPGLYDSRVVNEQDFAEPELQLHRVTLDVIMSTGSTTVL